MIRIAGIKYFQTGGGFGQRDFLIDIAPRKSTRKMLPIKYWVSIVIRKISDFFFRTLTDCSPERKRHLFKQNLDKCANNVRWSNCCDEIFYSESEDDENKSKALLETLRRLQERGRSLRDLNLRGIVFGSCDFSQLDLRGVIFDNCDLRGACFDAANLTGASFKNSIGVNATFIEANLTSVEMNNSNFTGADFTKADMRHVIASETNFQEATFKDAVAINANFVAADITSCNAIGLDLCGANTFGIQYGGGFEDSFEGVLLDREAEIRLRSRNGREDLRICELYSRVPIGYLLKKINNKVETNRLVDGI